MVFHRRTLTGACIWIHRWRFDASFKRPSMKTGVRLVKDEEKVNDFSSYAMNTIRTSFPPSSDIGVQAFFSCSFSNGRDKKGIVNVKRSASAYFSAYFSDKRSWIYYLRHKDPRVSYCSNFSSWNHFIHLLITCEFEDISYFLEKNLWFSWVAFYYLLPTLRQVTYMSWVFGTRKYTSVRSSSNVLNEPCCKWSREKQSQWFDVHYCILLLTSNSNLTINQLKSCIIFLFFRHEPINRFNVTPHSPPPIWLPMRQM